MKGYDAWKTNPPEEKAEVRQAEEEGELMNDEELLKAINELHPGAVSEFLYDSYIQMRASQLERINEYGGHGDD